MDVAWGGTDYDGSIIGDGSAWKEGLLKPIYRWIPSIAVSDMTFYVGDLFPDLKNKLLITSLKAQKLISLEFDGKKARNETILFEKIGRVRDVEANSVGEIFVIIESSIKISDSKISPSLITLQFFIKVLFIIYLENILFNFIEITPKKASPIIEPSSFDLPNSLSVKIIEISFNINFMTAREDRSVILRY